MYTLRWDSWIDVTSIKDSKEDTSDSFRRPGNTGRPKEQTFWSLVQGIPQVKATGMCRGNLIQLRTEQNVFLRLEWTPILQSASADAVQHTSESDGAHLIGKDQRDISLVFRIFEDLFDDLQHWGDTCRNTNTLIITSPEQSHMIQMM